MSTSKTSAKEIQDTINEFGYITLQRAARLHLKDGEGAQAISDYTGIPVRAVSRALRVQEVIAVVTHQEY